MLFMGSSKYPDENEYDSFISKSGGGSNAFTECEYTLYHFDVLPQHLEKVGTYSSCRARLVFVCRRVKRSSAALSSVVRCCFTTFLLHRTRRLASCQTNPEIG